MTGLLPGCSTSVAPGASSADSGCTTPTCPKPCDAGSECGDLVPEGGPGADASVPCGPTRCDPATTYCVNDFGGPAIDGGTLSSYTCDPLPTDCEGGAVTCACVSASGCHCTDDGGQLNVVCDFP